MKARRWAVVWILLTLALFALIGAAVCAVDPYFHYHAPVTDRWYYELNNERYQNDGILHHFDYDSVIIGNSMSHNFKTSEMDDLFGVNAIKTTFSGGDYSEMHDYLELALCLHPDLKMVLRSLDGVKLMQDRMEGTLDDPTYSYLFDKNPVNDVKYLLNRDVVFGRVLPMMVREGTQQGITSFDEYSSWQFVSGINQVTVDGVQTKEHHEPVHLTAEQKETIYRNITKNITCLAEEYPDTQFYCFFAPYSILWWQYLAEEGTIFQRVEAEEYAAQLMLKYDNIHLFCFSCRTDIISDLNNYVDTMHYCAWVNSLILRWMADGQYELTNENLHDYMQKELEVYLNYDYAGLNAQEDYTDDSIAEKLVMDEIQGKHFPDSELWKS